MRGSAGHSHLLLVESGSASCHGTPIEGKKQTVTQGLLCAQSWAGFTSTASQGLEGCYDPPHITDKETGSERARALP